MNLANMSPETLLTLRQQVDAELARAREKIEKDLRLLGMKDLRAVVEPPKHRGVPKGYKAKPKYRGPQGETWAGRGAVPRWMRAAMKATGKKREAFLIKKRG
jgi:DNA-binding protein H-NS